jgi:hypothetical protein
MDVETTKEIVIFIHHSVPTVASVRGPPSGPMTASSLPGSVIRISRLNVAYLVPREHPSPATVRSRLDRLLEQQLPSACASLLGPVCPESDPSVWFIRRLDVNLAVGANLETTQLAREWSEPLARTLQRTLSNSDTREDVLRFPSPAAYLAQFLRDLADGVAWSKWYYARFNGLRALPMNAALRDALCCEPATGEAALLQLANDGRLETVLRALTEVDCRTVLLAFCGIVRDAASSDVATSHLQVALEAWQSSRGLTGELPARHHTTLQLYLASQNGDVAAAAALLQAIRALLLCERDAEADIAEQLRAVASGRPLTVGVQAGERLFTPFGGVFWLLPGIDDLKLEECAVALPDFGDEAPAALVRFLVLLKCMGAPRAPPAFIDPILREVTGVSPDLSAADVRAWAQKVTRERTIDFQARWLANCLQQGVISRRWLRVRPARRGRLLLLADGERDTWLYVARSTQELVHYLEAGLQPNDPCSALRAAHALLCDPALAGMLPATVSGLPVRAWNSSEAAAWAAEGALLATCLERVRLPDEDLAYLSLVSLLRGARHLDLALSLAARSVVRNFAWRLPGFAWSSADFLYTNFLDVVATVEPKAEAWLVRVGRPPLHIVLAMTGASQDNYHVSWLDGRRVQLTTSAS